MIFRRNVLHVCWSQIGGGQFFVRAAAWRNGKFHLVAAAPAWGYAVGTAVEYNDLQKVILGNEWLQELRDQFRDAVAAAMKTPTSSMNAEGKPWVVTSWTAAQKASADAEFIKIMSPQTPLDKRQLEGLDAEPKLDLHQSSDIRECAPDSSWGDLWKRAFQRVGLIEKRGEPSLWLVHSYDCWVTPTISPVVHFYRVFDQILLGEFDLVFELNGSFVRAPGVLLSGGTTLYGVKSDAVSPTKGLFTSTITDFLVELALGNANAPPIAPRPRQ
jgi:hypothetical protein